MRQPPGVKGEKTLRSHSGIVQLIHLMDWSCHHVPFSPVFLPPTAYRIGRPPGIGHHGGLGLVGRMVSSLVDRPGLRQRNWHKNCHYGAKARTTGREAPI